MATICVIPGRRRLLHARLTVTQDESPIFNPSPGCRRLLHARVDRRAATYCGENSTGNGYRPRCVLRGKHGHAVSVSLSDCTVGKNNIIMKNDRCVWVSLSDCSGGILLLINTI
jgi:hypothetical protein